MQKRILEISLNRAIDEITAEAFAQEFKKLEDQRPDQINIRINSPGGSVLKGWSMVDVVLNSAIPTTAIVVGVAGSMATTLMAAANRAKIMEHGSIMVHIPYDPAGEMASDDPQLKTYASQILTLYSKRWGKTTSEVLKMMSGSGSADGTWYTAKEALTAGLVSEIIPLKNQERKRTISGMAAAMMDIHLKTSDDLNIIV